VPLGLEVEQEGRDRLVERHGPALPRTPIARPVPGASTGPPCRVRYASLQVPRFLTRFWRRIRDLWRRAKAEHSTPREVGWSVAIGVFCGCTPFIGFHMWMALGLATALRLNRLWAFLGSRISTNVVLAWIAFSEIQLAHRLRTGAWLPLNPADILAHPWQLFGQVVGDWLVGAILVGAVLAALLGALSYGLARRWRPRGVPLRPRTLEEPRPPSSGSRPSAPRAPTS
jgi:uncharacterized protein (DUF2062 family)